MNEKKQWQKPGLVILTRNKPEEAVLTSCKGATFTGTSGPSGHQVGCYTFTGTCNFCASENPS